jgi:hypothetical protein
MKRRDFLGGALSAAFAGTLLPGAPRAARPPRSGSA